MKKQRKKRLYIACSMHLFESRMYRNRIEKIHADYPEYDLLEPKNLFYSTEEWLANWKHILARIDLLIFFVDRHSSIGKGTYKEVVDCMHAKVPVVLLTSKGEYISLSDVQFTKGNESNWNYYSFISVKRRKTRLVKSA